MMTWMTLAVLMRTVMMHENEDDNMGELNSADEDQDDMGELNSAGAGE